MVIEKECELCGGFFHTTNKNMKYCDDCRAHMKARSSEYYYAQKRQYSYDKPIVKNYTCDVCRKSFKTTDKLLLKLDIKESDTLPYKRLTFCSKKCKDSYKVSHAKCKTCGKPIAGTPGYELRNWHTHFCSEECRQNYNRYLAKKNGGFHTCLRCGKEFIRKTSGFCSRECYLQAIKEGWKTSRPDNSPKTVKRNVICPVCKKQGVKTYFLPLKAGELERPVYCSEQCKQKANIQTKKHKLQQSKENQTKQRPPIRSSIPSLCNSCNTKYAGCEKILTDYKVYPEGSKKYKGSVIECPRYISNKDKSQEVLNGSGHT